MTTPDYSRLTLGFGSDEKNNPFSDPARILAYGAAKTRKTWWAGTAGINFNTFILDGENGTGILKNLPRECTNNISRIPLANNPNAHTTALFLTLMFKRQQFIYDMDEAREMEPQYLNDSHNEKLYLVCDFEQLRRDDVIVIDSWSQIVKDVGKQFMDDKGFDPFDGDIVMKNKGDTNLSFYRYSDLVLDAILQGINKLPCHVILIAHQDIYQHEFKIGGITKKESRIQVLSSSGNSAAKIPASVGEVLWFEHSDDLSHSLVHAEPSKFRDGGGRRIPPATHTFTGKGDDKDFTFTDYCKLAEIPIPKELRSPDERPPFTLMTGLEIRKSFGQVSDDANIVNK